MTRDNLLEALRWSIYVAVIIALWFGVLSVRKARAVISTEPGASAIPREQAPSTAVSENIRPVWVIVVYAVQDEKLIGITEFVFESYEECQKTSAEAKEKMDLHLKPVCYLRWLREGGGNKGNVM